MDRKDAEELLSEAGRMNEGAWTEHSVNVACLDERVARKAGMDSEKAYVLGLLHDIGRRNGTMQARHAIEGYQFLTDIGFDEGARICLTHTFQYKDVEAIYDIWDCNDEEKHFIADYLENITYDDYDKLIQLCDALSLTNGYCYAEKKMVNSVRRTSKLPLAIFTRSKGCFAKKSFSHRKMPEVRHFSDVFTFLNI